MDKQQLNNVFDAYNPTKEQKQKMFDNIKQKAYGKKTIDFKKIYIPMATVAAAAFIFAIGSGVLDQNAPAQLQTQIVQNTTTDIAATEGDEKSKTDNTAFEHSSTQVQSKPELDVTQMPKADQAAGSKANDEPQSNGGSIQQVIENAQPVEDIEVVPNQATTYAALNINTASQVPNSRMIDAPAQISAQDFHENSGYEITYEEFCQKAGIDITEIITVPSDMQNITQNQAYFNEGEIENWNITYIGDGARSININSSLDANASNSYFENEAFVKTDINGNEAVVFYDGSYTAYINSENVSYSITGVEITEQELSDILVSMIK